MRISTLSVTAIAVLITASWAEANPVTEPGSGFIQYRKPKSKEYYIVRKEGGGDQCSIVAGKWDNKPAGIVGTSPYATKEYAKAALKNFPECKGGESEETSGGKKSKTKSDKSSKSKGDKSKSEESKSE